jgi:hypothetical protein
MKFTESQLRIIDAALSVAADVYEQDAAKMDAENQPSVAQQMRRQIAQTRAISTLITDEIG